MTAPVPESAGSGADVPVLTGPVLEQAPPTQIQHPWRATIRTMLATAFAFVLIVPAVWAVVLDELARQGIVIPDQVQAVSAGVVAGCLALTGIIQRVALIPGVAALLHRIGVGPTPRTVTAQVAVDASTAAKAGLMPDANPGAASGPAEGAAGPSTGGGI